MAGLMQRDEMGRHVSSAANAYLYSVRGGWATPLEAIADLARARFFRDAANLLQRVPWLMENPPLSLWLSPQFADLLTSATTSDDQRAFQAALKPDEADVAAYVDTLRDPNKLLVYLANSQVRQPMTPLQQVSLAGVLMHLAPATVARLDERLLRAVRAVRVSYPASQAADRMMDTLLWLRPDFEEAAMDRWERRGPLIAAAYQSTQVPHADGADGLIPRTFPYPVGSDDRKPYRLVGEHAAMTAAFLGGRQRWRRY